MDRRPTLCDSDLLELLLPIEGMSEGQWNPTVTNEGFGDETGPFVMHGPVDGTRDEHQSVESVPDSESKVGDHGTSYASPEKREVWSAGRRLCTKCGIRERHRTHRIRRTICLECSREQANAQARIRRRNRISERVNAGRCLLCHAPRMPGIQMCEAHRQAKAARAQRGASARKAVGQPTPSQTSVAEAKRKGVCTTCHRRPPQGEGYATCRVCITYISNARKARRETKKNAVQQSETVEHTPVVEDSRGSASDPIVLEDSEDSGSNPGMVGANE
ncbi:hypothetical protein DL764_000169 [Monosporascus ibericus]|uniref:Uncharacterized protein n=1 Tax=Monosporascus ibericus TaxID=155417 RepID=A0A4Q4TZX2_9PEZI|nr:hypothetical protein DL764_000169 [Monosporascus ibericus]